MLYFNGSYWINLTLVFITQHQFYPIFTVFFSHLSFFPSGFAQKASWVSYLQFQAILFLFPVSPFPQYPQLELSGGTQHLPGKALLWGWDVGVNKTTKENIVFANFWSKLKILKAFFPLKQNHVCHFWENVRKAFPLKRIMWLIASEKVRVYLELEIFVSISHSKHGYRTKKPLKNPAPLF